jgi:hypothetical protein
MPTQAEPIDAKPETRSEARKALAKFPRRKVRYVCFRIRGGTEDTLPAEFADIVEPLRAVVKEAGRDFADFETGWDFGTDDKRTMASRPDKWFTWGIDRTAIVDVKRTDIGDGLRSIVAAGFGKRAMWGAEDAAKPGNLAFARAGVVMSSADYEAIMKDADTRKGW